MKERYSAESIDVANAVLLLALHPKIPLLFWGLGVIPTPMALALPAEVMTTAEMIVSIGIIWIGVVLWQEAATQ